MTNKPLPIQYFLDYEARCSWLAGWIWWDWGQVLMGKYLGWKVRRKYKRYLQSKRVSATMEYF